MSTCRACGDEIRAGEDVTEVGGAQLHSGCVEPHAAPRRRRVGSWAIWGTRNQTTMGAVQRAEYESRPD